MQIAGKEEGLGEWKLKPFYCIAYPVTVEEGVLTFDDVCQGDTLCCSLAKATDAALVDTCKAELEYILGSEGYRRLLEMRKSVQQTNPER